MIVGEQYARQAHVCRYSSASAYQSVVIEMNDADTSSSAGASHRSG
jgi:hypothetical protein